MVVSKRCPIRSKKNIMFNTRIYDFLFVCPYIRFDGGRCWWSNFFFRVSCRLFIICDRSSGWFLRSNSSHAILFYCCCPCCLQNVNQKRQPTHDHGGFYLEILNLLRHHLSHNSAQQHKKPKTSCCSSNIHWYKGELDCRLVQFAAKYRLLEDCSFANDAVWCSWCRTVKNVPR